MRAGITELRHGTFVKVAELGVLILGAPGAGKSALALALMDQPGRGAGQAELTTTLVADDQVCLALDKATAQVVGRPPATLAGLLEVRGVGIVQVDYLPGFPVGLVVELKKADEIERIPDFPNACARVLGQTIPLVEIATGDMAAAAKVRISVGVILDGNAVENSRVIR